MNNNEEVFLGNIMGPTIPVDDEVSATSENAVKSKAVKEYVDSVIGNINEALSTMLNGKVIEERNEEEG